MGQTLSALGNLRARGHFIQPTSTVELISEMQEESSSLFGFVEEACQIAPTNWVDRHITLRDAYTAYEHYSQSVGTKVVSRTRFRKDLMEVVGSRALPVTMVRPWIKDTRGESKRANWEINGLILTTEYKRIVTKLNKLLS